jgi:hypothetical protein
MSELGYPQPDASGTWATFETNDGELIQLKNVAHQGVPAAVAGANAGTTPPAPVVAAGSTDGRGTITFGTGTTPAAGAQVVVTFAVPFAVAPVVVLQPGNAATAALNDFVTAVSTTGFTIGTASAPAASQAAATFSVSYHVTG